MTKRSPVFSRRGGILQGGDGGGGGGGGARDACASAGGPSCAAIGSVSLGESRMSVEKPLVDVQGANEAAAKIQAGFRGYRVRKRLQEERKAKEKQREEPKEANEDKKKKQQQQRRMEEPPSALEDKSATKIQAGVRGFLVRKRQQAERAAATRIQAGFRGFRTRKLLKQNGQ